jgi:hypothetical protein
MDFSGTPDERPQIVTGKGIDVSDQLPAAWQVQSFETPNVGAELAALRFGDNDRFDAGK